jgi:hypothetical protein
MIFDLLARAFRQKAPAYIAFDPISPADPVLCVRCGRPHDDHHAHGACPLADGSGFSLNLLMETDLSILDQKVDLLEELSDETRKLAEDLREIGEA